MATNPYSYGSLGQRWTVGEPTSKSLLDVSRVKADANRWALEQLVVDPDDTANFVLTAPGLNIDSNTLYVDSVNNSVGFGLTNPNDYAFNGTPSWVASGGAGNASVIVVSGTTSIGYLSFADGTTGTDRYSGNIQYNHSTNTMSFRTNGGVEAMTVNSAQDFAVDTDTLFVDASADRVGINTSSPQVDFHVNNASTNGVARISTSHTSSYAQLQLVNQSGNYWYQTIVNSDNSYRLYNGSDRLIVDTSGNMGLGVTPVNDTKLHIQNSATSRYGINVKASNGNNLFGVWEQPSGDGHLYLRNSSGTAIVRFAADTASSAHYIASGNLGIGTTSPTATLTVAPTAHDAGVPAVWLHSADNAADHDGTVISSVNNGSDAEVLHVRTNNTTYANGTSLMLVRGDGNVGIGTVSPDGTLHVHTASAGSVTAHGSADDLVVESSADAGLSILTPAANNGRIYFGSPTNNAYGQIDYDHATNDMVFATAGAGRLTIDSSGRVGIGTSSPGYTLVVDPASTLGDGVFLAEFNATSNGVKIARYNCGSDNDRSGLYFENQGVVNARVWVDDSMNLRIQNSNPTANNSGTVVGTQTSDARLKEVFGPVASSLDEVLKLNPVRYALKNENRERLGFIAQEVKEVLPQTVYDTMVSHEDDDDTLLAMEYVGIIPVLVNAIKELNNRIAALEAA